jgi:uncharacterized membrane protein YccC
MTNHPIGEGARRRLQEAQRAEARALAETTKAHAACARVERKFDAARGEVDKAIARLVEVSGVVRAAQLLDQSVVDVKRALARGNASTAPFPGRDRPASP